MPTTAHRPLALAAVAAGLCWICLAVFTLSTPAEPVGDRVVLDGVRDHVGFGLFTGALVLTVAALLGLHLHHRGADGRLGRAGSRVAMLGAGAQSIVIGTILVTGEEPSWFGIAAPAAIFTWFAGSVAFGIAIRRAGVLPGWAGFVLPVVTLFAIVGSEGGTSVLIGAFLVFAGVRMMPAGAGAAPAPSRA